MIAEKRKLLLYKVCYSRNAHLSVWHMIIRGGSLRLRLLFFCHPHIFEQVLQCHLGTGPLLLLCVATHC